MRNFLHKVLVIICLFFVLGLVLGYVSVYVNPNTSSIPALFGLAYPYLLFINFIFLFYWIYRKRWTFLLPLFVIIAGWTTFSNYFAIGGSSSDVITQEVKVMSYNVRYFNRYNWNKDPETANKILEMVKSENVDVVCFQEFLLGNNNKISITSIKDKLVNYPYSHISKDKTLAIFSRYKLTNRNNISFDNSKSARAIYADVKMGRESIRIFNVHLESNRFNRKDYEFIKKLGTSPEEQDIDAAKGITKRLKYAFKKRANQAQLLSEIISTSQRKSILCLDMNDTPVSYAYRTSRGDMNDSFLEKGSGIGTTYVGDFPSYRIDYVFHHKDIECVSYRISRVKYSDHYPLIVGFRKDF